MSESDETFQRVYPDGFTIRDEANALVAMAFRNGPLEKLHKGKHSELLSDPSLSRMTGAEMKTLMINACEHLERLLRLKQDDPEAYDREIKAGGLRYCRKWNR